MRTLALLLGLLAAVHSAPAAGPVDYPRDVRPILAANCTTCHGPAKQRAGLRLDSVAAIRLGGNTGAIVVPGKSGESLLIHAVTGTDDAPVMPPKGARLSADQVAVLKAWIDQGANGPADATVTGPAKSSHWSFQPVRLPEPPAVRDTGWCRNPIDRFILARLEREGLRPSPEADRATLVRRLSLDLLGLPPTPAEVDAFVADTSPDAYEKVVDRLLASPHYGERWGRHWLDLARYADSNGYSIDAPRSIWPYRDWVIHALNADLPFDRFTVEQLAGDLLPNATRDQVVATGFHRNTPINEEGGINVEQFRIESVVDRVNTTGTVWLGLTVGCCQCHDHKFDPLPQRDYYRLFAFLNNQDEPKLELASPEQLTRRKQLQAEQVELQKRLRELDPVTPERVEAWEHGLGPETRAALPKAVQAILNAPPNGRTAKQIEALAEYVRKLDKVRHAVGGVASPWPLLPLAHAHALTVRTDLEKRLAALKKREPDVTSTLVLKERATPRETHVLLGGDFTRPGVAVQPGVPGLFGEPGASATGGPLVADAPGSPKTTRLDLARWLVDPANPLTARVTVNRFWQGHFGGGLVETENDFGTQGTPPSHPELLDWLASEFVRQGWSMKALHRLIVTSATYRQSSRARPDLAQRDPRNRLLARMPRLRLEAEVVRDVALAASGLLNPAVGGPSVYPPQPDGVYQTTQVQRDWKASAGLDRYRRGLYTYFYRTAPHPSLTAFDAPDATTACTRRNRSNTPLQALTLLNDRGFVECAEGLAKRVQREGPADDAGRLRFAFRLGLGRPPTDREARRLGELLAALRANGGPADDAWVGVGRVLLNLDEFITRE
jgi:mono/diheme cytochrome c family protein